VSKGSGERLPLFWDTTGLALPQWEGQTEGIYQTTGRTLMQNKVVTLKPGAGGPQPAIPGTSGGGMDTTRALISEAWESDVRGITLFELVYGGSFPAVVRHGEAFVLNFDVVGTIEASLFERYRTERRAWLTYLPVPYHAIVPRRLRAPIKRLSGLLRGGMCAGAYPRWPMENWLMFLMALFPWSTPDRPWPGRREFALVLSHDVESAEGVKLAEEVAKVEADFGVKSTWFITGRFAGQARSLADRLKADGHEIGLHGVEHDMVLPFLSRADMEKRLDSCQSFIDDYDIKGFRSPALLRSDLMYDVIGERFAYDSSVVDTGRLAPHACPTGCGTIFPFRRGRIPVVPITIPFDASLLFLGCKWHEMWGVWLEKVDFIQSEGGVAVMDTHPEPHFSGNPEGLDAYVAFLKAMRSRRDRWCATMGELVDFVTQPDKGASP